MDKKFCPFVNGQCRDDCVFRCGNVLIGRDLVNCLIAVKISDINELQSDELDLILKALESRKG